MNGAEPHQIGAHAGRDGAKIVSAPDAGSPARRRGLQHLRGLRRPGLVIRDGGTGEIARDSIYVLSRGLTPVRPVLDPALESNGGEFEVGFRVLNSAEGPALWRRVDMGFDEYQDAGGVASEVARDVVSFSVTAGDADGVFAAWDSDLSGLPHMVVIEVRSQTPDGRGTAVARRVASLPRVSAQPTPAEAETTTPGGGA